MPRKLNGKQLAFRAAYIRCGFNATEAARQVGYKDPNHYGPLLTKKPQMQAAIQAAQEMAMQHAIIDQNWVLGKIKECVEYCMQPDAQGRINPDGAAPHLKMLGQYLKLFTDKIEIESAQIEHLLGEIVRILKSTLPEELLPAVSEKLARLSEAYGYNNADRS